MDKGPSHDEEMRIYVLEGVEVELWVALVMVNDVMMMVVEAGVDFYFY
jgi:hypothetical protein